MQSTHVELTQKNLAYLNTLPDEEYKILREHLIKMHSLQNRNAQIDDINALTFSECADIVTSARQAIIQHVKKKIPKNAANFLFLLGMTGSGKTTALCFFRGDEIKLVDENYESTRTDYLIGNMTSKSTTFLPNIEQVDTLTIVDFPGFEDSHGYLIQLGIELAIKALIRKYQPIILIFTPLQGECQLLNEALQRVIGKKSLNNCMLAITKYTRDFHASKIHNYIMKPLLTKSKKEKFLSYQADALKSLQLSSEEERFKVIEEQLKKIQNQKLSNSQKRASSVPTIMRESVQILEKRHNYLQAELGIKNRILQLDYLDDPEYRIQCLNILKKQKKVRVDRKLTLASDHEKLLTRIFINEIYSNLDSRLSNEKSNVIFKTSEELEKYINDYSFFLATQGASASDLFLLPEMDQSLIFKFDTILIRELITNIINSISQLNLSFIKKLLPNSQSDPLIEKFLTALSNLENQVKDMRGLIKDEVATNEDWKKQDQLIFPNNFEAFAMPKWVEPFTFISAEKPVKLLTITQGLSQFPEKTLNDQMVEQCIIEIDTICRNLSACANIKQMIFHRYQPKKNVQNTALPKIAGNSNLLFPAIKEDVSISSQKKERVTIPTLDLSNLRKNYN